MDQPAVHCEVAIVAAATVWRNSVGPDTNPRLSVYVQVLTSRLTVRGIKHNKRGSQINPEAQECFFSRDRSSVGCTWVGSPEKKRTESACDDNFVTLYNASFERAIRNGVSHSLLHSKNTRTACRACTPNACATICPQLPGRTGGRLTNTTPPVGRLQSPRVATFVHVTLGLPTDHEHNKARRHSAQAPAKTWGNYTSTTA